MSDVYSTAMSKWTIDVTVVTDAIAAFVWLDISSNLQGRFSKNGFLMTEQSFTVRFYSNVEIKKKGNFRKYLTVRHLAQIIR